MGDCVHEYVWLETRTSLAPRVVFKCLKCGDVWQRFLNEIAKDYVHVLNNLTATQGRCSELLEVARKAKALLVALTGWAIKESITSHSVVHHFSIQCDELRDALLKAKLLP